MWECTSDVVREHTCPYICDQPCFSPLLPHSVYWIRRLSVQKVNSIIVILHDYA